MTAVGRYLEGLTRFRVALAATWCAAALTFAVAWWPVVAGDAVIHLTFMEHAAGGRWFEFNPGFSDASSSSVAWTVLGAAMWAAGGASATLVGVKAISFGALLLLGALTAGLARQLEVSRPLAAAAGLLAISLPGPVMNSLVGMENGTFACLLLLNCWLLGRQLAKPSAGGVALAFAAIGLAAALRPEGAVTGALLGAAYAWHLFARQRRRAPLLLAAAAVSALLLWGPFFGLFYASTGEVIPSSGVSRVMAARRQDLSLALGPLWLYARPLALLAAYLPLPLLAVRGAVESFRGSSEPSATLGRGLALLIVAGLVLYTLVTGAFHASRYLSWLLAVCVPLGALGAEAIRRRGTGGRRLLAGAAVWLLSVGCADAAIRLTRHRAMGHRLADLTLAVAERGARTERLLEGVCRYGCCERTLRPAVALAEVQLRFFLDDRLDVVSIDGTTAGPGRRPVRFDRRGCPDLDAIAATPSVVALLHGFSGYGLEGCLDSDWSRAVASGWSTAPEAPSIPGWRWETRPRRMLVRDCSTD